MTMPSLPLGLRRRTSVRALPALITGLAAACFAQASASAITVSLEALPASVQPGGAIDLSIRISGLGNGTAPSLGAFDLDLGYDTTVFVFDSIVLGDPLLGDLLGPIVGSSSGDSHDALAGVVNAFSVSLDSATDLDAAQPDSFILGTLRFTAATTGTAGFTLANIVLADVDGADLPADVLSGTTVVVRDTTTPRVPDQGFAGTAGLLLAFSIGASRFARRA